MSPATVYMKVPDEYHEIAGDAGGAYRAFGE
jgi:hypothetical protein